MLMTAGAAYLAVALFAAVVGLAALIVMGVIRAAADLAESRRLYAEKAARRARIERRFGLNR